MGYSSWWGVRNRSPVCKISTEIFHQKRVCEIPSYYTGKTLVGLQKVQILRLQVRLSAEVHGSCRSLGNNCLDVDHLFFTSWRDVAMGGCWPAGRQTLWERATNNEVCLVLNTRPLSPQVGRVVDQASPYQFQSHSHTSFTVISISVLVSFPYQFHCRFHTSF